MTGIGHLLRLSGFAQQSDYRATNRVICSVWPEISSSHRTEGLKQMTLECINPPDLPTPVTYTQVVVAQGTKLIFVSGQQPEDVHGKLVGRGDFAFQVRQVFANLGRALAAA